MTWGGAQGFQSPLQNDSFIVEGMGALGNTQTERGLTYVEVALSGHMVPQFSPAVCLPPFSPPRILLSSARLGGVPDYAVLDGFPGQCNSVV